MNTSLDNTYDALAWGSHLPALLACLAATEGPVIELGVGHFSTPALHAFCMTVGRDLVSVEDNVDWFIKFSDKYTAHQHTFLRCNYDNLPARILDKKWSVAFIDNSPGGERRKKDFKRLLPLSEFVVVHDHHRENEQAIDPLLNYVRYHVCREYQPPTLVATVCRDLPKVIFDL